MTDQNIAEVAAIAAKLTKASRRALLRSKGENVVRQSNDAYSLWWGRNYELGLVEEPRWVGEWYYLKLTPLGLAVRAYLLSENHK